MKKKVTKKIKNERKVKINVLVKEKVKSNYVKHDREFPENLLLTYIQPSSDESEIIFGLNAQNKLQISKNLIF